MIDSVIAVMRRRRSLYFCSAFSEKGTRAAHSAERRLGSGLFAAAYARAHLIRKRYQIERQLCSAGWTGVAF